MSADIHSISGNQGWAAYAGSLTRKAELRGQMEDFLQDSLPHVHVIRRIFSQSMKVMVAGVVQGGKTSLMASAAAFVAYASQIHDDPLNRPLCFVLVRNHTSDANQLEGRVRGMEDELGAQLRFNILLSESGTNRMSMRGLSELRNMTDVRRMFSPHESTSIIYGLSSPHFLRLVRKFISQEHDLAKHRKFHVLLDECDISVPRTEYEETLQNNSMMSQTEEALSDIIARASSAIALTATFQEYLAASASMLTHIYLMDPHSPHFKDGRTYISWKDHDVAAVDMSAAWVGKYLDMDRARTEMDRIMLGGMVTQTVSGYGNPGRHEPGFLNDDCGGVMLAIPGKLIVNHELFGKWVLATYKKSHPGVTCLLDNSNVVRRIQMDGKYETFGSKHAEFDDSPDGRHKGHKGILSNIISLLWNRTISGAALHTHIVVVSGTKANRCGNFSSACGDAPLRRLLYMSRPGVDNQDRSSTDIIQAMGRACGRFKVRHETLIMASLELLKFHVGANIGLEGLMDNIQSASIKEYGEPERFPTGRLMRIPSSIYATVRGYLGGPRTRISNRTALSGQSSNTFMRNDILPLPFHIAAERGHAPLDASVDLTFSDDCKGVQGTIMPSWVRKLVVDIAAGRLESAELWKATGRLNNQISYLKSQPTRDGYMHVSGDIPNNLLEQLAMMLHEASLNGILEYERRFPMFKVPDFQRKAWRTVMKEGRRNTMPSVDGFLSDMLFEQFTLMGTIKAQRIAKETGVQIPDGTMYPWRACTHRVITKGRRWGSGGRLSYLDNKGFVALRLAEGKKPSLVSDIQNINDAEDFIVSVVFRLQKNPAVLVSWTGDPTERHMTPDEAEATMPGQKASRRKDGHEHYWRMHLVPSYMCATATGTYKVCTSFVGQVDEDDIADMESEDDLPMSVFSKSSPVSVEN